MKKRLLCVITLCIALLLVTALVGCQGNGNMPMRQGSTIMAYDRSFDENMHVNVYSDYKEFSQSPYGSKVLDECSKPAKDSIYNRTYFHTRDLVVVRFSDYVGNKHYIRNIDSIDGKYTVNIDRLSHHADKMATYVCLLEVAKSKHIGKDVTLNFREIPIRQGIEPCEGLEQIVNFMCTSVEKTEDMISVMTWNSVGDVEAYAKNKVTDITREILKDFDDAFFTKYKVLGIDTINYTDNMMMALEVDGSTLKVKNYYSDHYQFHEPMTARVLRLLVLPKDKVIDSVHYELTREVDFDEKADVKMMDITL